MYEQPFNPFAANLAVVKGYFKNGKVLALGVLYIISAIVAAATSVISAFGENNIVSDMTKLLGQFDPALASEAERYIGTYGVESTSSVSLVFNVLISAALIILIAAAFLIIYSKSKNDDPQSTPLGGVNILYVLSVIAMVFMIIGFILGLLVLIGLFFLIFFYAGDLTGVYEYSGYQIDLDVLSQALMPLYIIVAIISLIVLIFALVAAVNRKRYYGSIKESLTTVELQNKGAKGFGVICVISAVFTALSLFGSVGTILAAVGAGMSSATLIAVGSNFVTTLLSFLILVFEARVALGYKKYIDDQKYGYKSTPYNAVQGGFATPVDNGENPYADAPRQTYGDSYTDYSAPRQTEARPMVCPHCGAPLEEGAAFCGNCGAKL